MRNTNRMLLYRKSDLSSIYFADRENSLTRVVIHLLRVDPFSIVLWGLQSLLGKLLISHYLIPQPHLKWASESIPAPNPWLLISFPSLVSALKDEGYGVVSPLNNLTLRIIPVSFFSSFRARILSEHHLLQAAGFLHLILSPKRRIRYIRMESSGIPVN